MSLNLKDVYYQVSSQNEKTKNEKWHSEWDMNTINTMSCHLSSRMFLSFFKN
jgi:hypothetical protein